MDFAYLDEHENHPLIDHFYRLKVSRKSTPFKSLILPIGQTNITYVFCKDHQLIELKNKELRYKDLILTGQIYGCYNLTVFSESVNLGFAFKPTSLYKLLNRDVSVFNNKYVSLEDIDKNLHHQLETIFITYKEDIKQLKASIYELFDSRVLSDDKNLPHIDSAVEYILANEGLLKVNDLLDIVPLSQKSLEIQFKKIVGLTPGKYIRQLRFISLMRKYQSKEIDLQDLIYKYNYYDTSHFNRDFKTFLGQTPKTFFKSDYPLFQKYLIEKDTP